MSDASIYECDIIQTCYAFPEQYEVKYRGKQIGYLRLRNGYFYAAFPDAGGKIVYETENCKGDGRFEDDEREEYLAEAVIALFEAHLGARK